MSEEKPTRIYEVPMGYSWEWIMSAWDLAKANYGLALGIIFTLAIMNIILSKIPFVGSLAAVVMSALLSPGFLRIAHRWVKKEPTKFSDLFEIFENKDLFNRMLPYLIFTFLISIPSAAVGVMYSVGPMRPPMLVLGGSLLFSLVVSLFTAFSVPQMMFSGKAFKETIMVNFDAITGNIFPIFISFLIFSALAGLSLILFVLPFFFVTLPAMLPIYYLVYATIFEGLKLPLVHAEIKEVPQQLE